MIGVSEEFIEDNGINNALKQELFKPRLSGQAKDRANSDTETRRCHTSQLQTATIAALRS